MENIDRSETLPTYKEFYENSFPNLVEAIKFHYDVDIDNFIGDPWEVVAEVASNPNWLEQFHEEFEENLRDREYIK